MTGESEDWNIIKFQIGHLDRIASLESKNSGWNAVKLQDQLDSSHGWHFVAEELLTRQAIGYIFGQLVAGEAEIFRLGVDAGYR